MRVLRGRAISTLVLVLVVLAGSVGTAGASFAHKKKALSLSNVTITAGLTTDPVTEVTPLSRGFYQQQGLNVTPFNDPSGNANLITDLLSGEAQFIVVGASTGLVDFAAGAPVRGIFAATVAPAQEILLSSAAAAQFHVPATGDNQAGALAQLAALKGSHATIGVSNTVSESYLDLSGLGALHGFTVGQSAADDIDIVTTGSANTLAAGLQAGKFDGIANSPPTTVIAGYSGITIQLARIAPLNDATWLQVLTTTAMIQQHRDTVQAMVNALTEGYNYAKTHGASASKIANSTLSQYAITSPEEQEFLDQEFISHLPPTPALTKSSIDDELDILKANNPTLKVTFAQFADNSFVDSAIKTLGYHYQK